jgi:hypothetical protein
MVIPNYPYYNGYIFDFPLYNASYPYINSIYSMLLDEETDTKYSSNGEIVLYYNKYPTIKKLLSFKKMRELRLEEYPEKNVKDFSQIPKLHKLTNLKKLRFIYCSVPSGILNNLPIELEVLEIMSSVNCGLQYQITNFPPLLKELIIQINRDVLDIKNLYKDLKNIKLPHDCNIYVLITDYKWYTSWNNSWNSSWNYTWINSWYSSRESSWDKIFDYFMKHQHKYKKKIQSIMINNIYFIISHRGKLYDVTSGNKCQSYAKAYTEKQVRLKNEKENRENFLKKIIIKKCIKGITYKDILIN